MDVIAVTGTPGAGKTHIAKRLSGLLGFLYVDINREVKKHRLYEEYDPESRSFIVAPGKLTAFLLRELKSAQKKENFKGAILDSHMSHYMPPGSVRLCIVAKCSLPKLKSRLARRKYPPGKIRENLDSEIFDVCLNEAKGAGHKVLVIDTTSGRSVNKALAYLSKEYADKQHKEGFL